MKKLCKKFISLVFAAILFSAAIGLTLCLHEDGQLHFTPSKTQECVRIVYDVEVYSPHDSCCLDVGFDIDSNIIVSTNLVQAIFHFALPETFEVKALPKIVSEPEIFSVKNAPPYIVLGGLYYNILSRLIV